MPFQHRPVPANQKKLHTDMHTLVRCGTYPDGKHCLHKKGHIKQHRKTGEGDAAAKGQLAANNTTISTTSGRQLAEALLDTATNRDRQTGRDRQTDRKTDRQQCQHVTCYRARLQRHKRTDTENRTLTADLQI